MIDDPRPRKLLIFPGVTRERSFSFTGGHEELRGRGGEHQGFSTEVYKHTSPSWRPRGTI